MWFLQRRPLATAVVLAAVLTGHGSRADEIYGLGGDGAWQLGAANNRLAETFTTGSLRMNLDSVSPLIRNANAANSSSIAGTLNMWLFATDGDRKPTGSALFTIASNFEVWQWYNQSATFSNLSYTLNPNTTYAVVFQGSSGSTISWKYRNDGAISSSISPTPTFRDWASSDNGSSWGDGAPSVGYIMTVNASNLATPFTWTGGGSSNDWRDTGNWSGGATPVSSGYAEIVFAGSSRTTNTNNLGNWRDVGRIQFASGAGSFTLGGDTFGFVAYAGSGAQRIEQNSANTQTIGVGEFSFRNAVNSEIYLNAGDLVITSPNVYIDMSSSAYRSLYITGNDTTRRTLTIAGNLAKGGSGNDPDLYVQNNKRLLVTGSIATGSGNDGSIFIDSGVLEFGSTGAMTGGSPVVGALSGSGTAAVYLNSAGSTFARQIEIRGGSSGPRIVGGLNTSGTVTYSGNFISSNSLENYDLKAATGGAADFTGTRNFSAGLFVNRPDTATYGGTVILSGTTSSDSFTALEAGTLQISDLNRIGTGYFEFNASSGDSGTLRYTGGSASTTKTLYIDNAGITRAAIDVSQAGTTLTWNPGSSGVNQNLTKVGAGTLSYGGPITGAATVGVEGGTLLLTASNSYSGPTTVSAGRLQVNSSNAISSGTVTLGNSNTGANNASLFIDATTVNATVSRPIVISNQGSGTATLGSASTGGVNIAAFSGAVSLGRDVFLNGGTTGDRLGFTGGISGTGNVNVNGSNRVLFSGAANTYTGSTAILAGATLQLGDGGVTATSFIPDSSNVNVAGTLSLAKNGNSETINALIGSGTVQAFYSNNTLNVGGANGSGTFSGVLNQTSGTLSLVKAGTGTQVLAGVSTYTGSTTVSAGRLAVNGSLGNTAVSVASGAALGGSGVIGGTLSVLAGGTLSPGNSIESLAVGATTFSGSSTFAYEVDSSLLGSLGTAADLLVVNGDLSIASGSILSITDFSPSPAPFVGNTTIFALINYSGMWNNGLFTYNGSPLADGSRFFVGSQEWEIDYNRTSSAGLDNFTDDYISGSFVTITAVPEPSTWPLALASLAGGSWAMRRRRRTSNAS